MVHEERETLQDHESKGTGHCKFGFCCDIYVSCRGMIFGLLICRLSPLRDAFPVGIVTTSCRSAGGTRRVTGRTQEVRTGATVCCWNVTAKHRQMVMKSE